MKLQSITGCENSSNRFTGISFTLRNVTDELILQEFGRKEGFCSILTLSSQEYVESITVTFTNQRIEYISIVLNSASNQFWGTKSSLTFQKNWSFSSEFELIGLYGTDSPYFINSLGVIVFKADRCPDGILQPNSSDQEGEDGNSEYVTVEPFSNEQFVSIKVEIVIAAVLGINLITICIIIFFLNKQRSRRDEEVE